MPLEEHAFIRTFSSTSEAGVKAKCRNWLSNYSLYIIEEKQEHFMDPPTARPYEQPTHHIMLIFKLRRPISRKLFMEMLGFDPKGTGPAKKPTPSHKQEDAIMGGKQA